MMTASLRSLARAPGFTSVAIVTLALGIGATTALFSVVDAVLLEPLALPDAGRLVSTNTAWPGKSRVSPRMTGGDFLDLRAGASSVSAMALYNGGDLAIRLPNRTRFAKTFFADPGFFDVLKVQPVLGHAPEANKTSQTAMVTVSFAQSSFGDAARALGQMISVDNKPYDIIGLVRDEQAFPEKAEVWITGPMEPENRNRTAFNYYALGRLRDGVDPMQAKTQLATLGERMAAAHPESNKGKTFQIVPLQEQLTAPVRTTLLFLFGGAALLLLISCANVANLMLARAAKRAREISIRLSLGASGGRVVQLLLAEGVLLGCGAAILGVGFAYLALRIIYPLIATTVPHAAAMLSVRMPVLLFAVGVSLITVILCSLVPALQMRRTDPAEALKQTPSRGLVGGGDGLRSAMIVAQVALCCMLCVGAALLSRTLLALSTTSLGFRTEGVLVMYASAPAFQMNEYLRAIRTFEDVVADVQHLRGVRSAAAVMGLPTGQYGSNGMYLVEGIHIQPGQDPFQPRAFGDNLPSATFSLASARYFETVGIRLLAGRDFNGRDQNSAPFTAIVSEALARQTFGNSNPIGRRIYCGLDSPKPMTIVGVVSDVKQNSPASKMEPAIYMPFQQHPAFANDIQIVARTDGDAMRLAPEVRKTMGRLAPFVATRFTTFTDMVQDSIAAPRFRAELAIAFAVLAMALAVAGVYGIMTYYVTERSRELGLRMALGAGQGSIIALVSRRAFWLASCGLVIGIGSTLALSRLAESLLYGVDRLDAATYCFGAGAVLLVVMLAAFLPSWQASRLDPAITLRSS